MRHTTRWIDKKRIITVLLLSMTMIVSATRYYVSTSGSNANDGLNTATPWKTIQYAEANATKAGDVIALKKGDVWLTDIALGIHHGGISGNPITWDGALWGSGANAIIRSSADRRAPNMSVVNITGCNYVTFQNITVDGNNTYTFGLVVGGTDNMYSAGGVQDSEKGITIRNSSVLNCGNGANYTIGFLAQTWNNGMSDITIQGNTFDGAGDELLSFYNGKSADGGTPAECKNVYIGYNSLTNWGRRGKSTGYGLQINNKITDVVIEHNTLTTGPDGHGNALQIESNETLPGWFPDRITVRYNKIHTTTDNNFGIYITQGQAKTVFVYSNLIYSETKTTNGGGIWIVSSTSPSWSGAELKFYNNTIYTLAGRSFNNDCAVPGVVTFKNNLIYNAGYDNYGMMCLVNNVAGASNHSNNLYYRSENTNYTKIKDGGSYIQTPTQVLSWEADAIVTAPLFKNPGTDFRLQEGSPAIGAGIPISGITKDIEGRTVNNPPDIGCYQSSGNLTNLIDPVYLNAVLNESLPNMIEITYDLNLANVVPDVSAFSVQVNSINRALSSVAIAGEIVHLTLISPLEPGEIATVSYTRPDSDPLQSISGGLAASFSEKMVINNLTTAFPVANDNIDKKLNITINPNPAHHILNISWDFIAAIKEPKIFPNSIRIFDMSGKLVLQKRLIPGSVNLQIPINLKSGLYTVILVSGSLKLSSQKLIVYN